MGRILLSVITRERLTVKVRVVLRAVSLAFIQGAERTLSGEKRREAKQNRMQRQEGPTADGSQVNHMTKLRRTTLDIQRGQVELIYSRGMYS